MFPKRYAPLKVNNKLILFFLIFLKISTTIIAKKTEAKSNIN